VLRPGGVFLFNVWNRVEENPVTQAVATSLEAMFPDNPPSFFRRVPFGYHDRDRIRADLRGPGFLDIDIETVNLPSRSSSARDVATGLCHGTPIKGEIEERGPHRLDEATAAAAAALIAMCGGDSVDSWMSAHVVKATA
jgi:hypothetical protein